MNKRVCWLEAYLRPAVFDVHVVETGPLRVTPGRRVSALLAWWLQTGKMRMTGITSEGQIVRLWFYVVWLSGLLGRNWSAKSPPRRERGRHDQPRHIPFPPSRDRGACRELIELLDQIDGDPDLNLKDDDRESVDEREPPGWRIERREDP